MGSIFFEITIIICLASFFSIVFKALKQPVILAYILTGIIIGPFGQLQFQNQEELRTLAQLGVTLLLFMLGLELKISDLRSTSGIALLAGVLQIIITFFAGFEIAQLLGFSQIDASYIGIALTFSSTIIAVKLMSDKKDLNSLYGKLSVGILLVQDFFAVFILMFLSAFNATSGVTFSLSSVFPVFFKGIILLAVIIFLGKTIFPRIMNYLSSSSETLFLFSLAWVFGLCAFVASPAIGFTIEIGGFLAGLALASSMQNYQIMARVKSLRDFFITIFFVFLGMQMTFLNISSLLVPVVIFCAFVFLGKPLIIMSILGAMGYRKRTSFLTGVSLSQISEFSLIIVFLGVHLGHISSQVVSLITMIGVISFVFSTYFIMRGTWIFEKLKPSLSIFEKTTTRETAYNNKSLSKLTKHVVLIGAHRMGRSILDALREEGEQVLVVDFDPNIMKELRELDVMSIFGDIADEEIQERAMLAQAKLVISTVPDLEDNLMLLKNLKRGNLKEKIIVLAQNPIEAKELYKAGAYYVVMPHIIGGRHLAKMIKEGQFEKS